MSIITRLFGKVSPAALALMLTVALLSLYEAGFDHRVVYWVLFILATALIVSAVRGDVLLNINLKNALTWYGLFLLWAGISIFWSINPHRTMVEFLQLSVYGLVILLATNLNRDNILRVARIVLFTGFAISLFGISQFLFLKSTRIFSTFSNPNPFGIYLVMLFLFGWGYYLRLKNKYLAVISVTLLITLALTGSRGSYICFLLALPLIFLGLPRNELKTAAIKTVICIMIALLITQGLVQIAPYLQEVFSKSVMLKMFLTRPETFIAWSGLSRLAYWQTAIAIAFSNPITGTGLGTFYLASFTEYTGGIWYSRFSHNHYLQTLAETGFVGFGLFIGFLAMSIRAIWIKLKKADYPLYYPGIIAATAAFMIHIGADFSFNFPAAAVIFFLSVGVIIGGSNNEDAGVYKYNKINLAFLMIIAIIISVLSAWQLYTISLYTRAFKLDAQRDYSSAVQIYDYANKIYPINAIAFTFSSDNYYRLAKKQDDEQLLEKSLQFAEKAVMISPVDSNLHTQLGWLYWETGHLDEAEHHLRLAVEYAGYRIGKHVDLGWFLIEQERFEDAAVIIKQGLELEKYAMGSHPTVRDIEVAQQNIDSLHKLSEMVK